MKPRMHIVREAAEPAEGRSSDHWARLVARAQHGEVAAFERLVREHHQELFGFALGFTGDRAEAADVAQEALVKAFLRIGSYRFAAPFRSWLLQIARNTCRDRYRLRQIQRRRLDEYGREVRREGPATPEEQLQAREHTEQVYDALRQVDTPFREVVLLFDLQGLSYREIAEVCQVPVGTVKSRLRRGRDALRRVIEARRERGDGDEVQR